MVEQKKKSIFVEGAITPEMIAKSISHHSNKTNIGAHDIFLGQVRADNIDGKIVESIMYTAHSEMAEKIISEIRENAFKNYNLSCLHIYHSIGIVGAGGICLFVFSSSSHRNDAMDSCRFIVEEIKKKLPIFGKEIFEDGKHQWKVNN